jgi:tetratricopeptide (TPR) repeat protein
VAALTGSALAVRKTAPYVTAGWAWYLVALAPMLHIQPMGMDRHADRYTYLPGIGIAMALCWGVRAWASRPRAGRAAARIERWAVPALSAAGVLAMASLAWDQELIWRDSPTLWSATLENCGPSALAENGLASSLQAAGRSREALEPAIAAVKMGPWLPYAHLNLANCLMSLHRPRLAIREYMLQLQQAPDNAEAHANLGAALLSVGRAREGIAETEIGLRLDPTQEVARRNLARCTGGAVPPGS